MTLEEKVHGLRLHVIQRAAQLRNVSWACREARISRTLFYRWRQRLEHYGQDGDLGRESHRGISAAPLAAARGPSTVQRALRRAGLAARRQRLTILEHRTLQRSACPCGGSVPTTSWPT